MNKKFFFLALIGIVFVACTGAPKSSISGNIEGGEGKTIYLERFVNNHGVLTDSTVIAADGSFLLIPTQPLEMNFYRLILDEKDFVVIISDSTESLQLNGKAGELNMGAKITGSENTEMLREFEASCQAIYEKQEKAVEQMRAPGVSPEMQSQLRQQAMDARKELSDMVKKWLESHSSTPTALAAVQMLDIRAEGATYKKVVEDLGKTFAHSTHFKMLKQRVEQLNAPVPPPMEAAQEVPGSKIAVGQAAPEIALPDPTGKVRKLSDLKGKVVLIDFWASWCGPCRRENPNVVKAYNTYKKDGFEVMSVSLDKDGNAWKQAIQQDGLVWPNHVSDLLFWNSKAAADYGVHSIPFPVLIDKKGIVVAYGPNVRGEMLESHLKEMFGH
ncbi:MAG: redoxin family protein [Flavobacteriales bacterium]|jgi:thiol-disulfide isomerase/thioredoxin